MHLTPVKQLALYLTLCFALLLACSRTSPKDDKEGVLIPAPAAKRLSQEQFGVDVGGLEVIQSNFGEKEYLGDVLRAYHVDQETIDSIAARSQAVFDVRRMKAGHAYTILKDKDQGVRYFIYERSKSELVVFELGEDPKIFETHMPVLYRQREVAGEIASSLYESLEIHKSNPQIALMLEDIYGSTLDFFKLKPGDTYKVIYQEAIVNGEVVGINKVVAAWIGHDHKDYYALGFEQEGVWGYFDETGKALKRTLRRAPIKLPSSGKSWQHTTFNPAKPAEGVSYTIPAATKVYALGDGVVTSLKKTAKGYRVVLTHDHELETEYLTLDPLSTQLKMGAKMVQGQLMGKVSGSKKKHASHLQVCYRHKGKAISPDEAMELSFELVKEGQIADFEAVKKNLLRRLMAMPNGIAAREMAGL